MGSHRVGWRECRVRREKGGRGGARGLFGGRGARRQCGDGNARGQLVRAAVLGRRRAGRRTSSRIVQRNVQRETEFFYLPLRVELPSGVDNQGTQRRLAHTGKNPSRTRPTRGLLSTRISRRRFHITDSIHATMPRHMRAWREWEHTHTLSTMATRWHGLTHMPYRTHTRSA